MPPPPKLVEALHSKEFEEMLPRLVAYAARRLRRYRWAEGDDHRPAAAEAEEVVSDAVEAALSGKRVWPDDMSLETFLSGVMWSQLAHRYANEKQARRGKRTVDRVEERAAPNDVVYARRALLAAIEVELAKDTELYTLFEAMCAGAYTPGERATRLGWSPERERLVHRRMNRQLAATDLRPEPGLIGPEPLPGGRWIRPPGGDES
jgi:DNA-directed RNA polymerase specialized sigma24 family protein